MSAVSISTGAVLINTEDDRHSVLILLLDQILPLLTAKITHNMLISLSYPEMAMADAQVNGGFGRMCGHSTAATL